jgi:hypothetical protein
MTLAPQEIAQHSCAGKRVLQMVGVNPKEIGQIGAGKRNPTGRIDVAMIQSLVRRESVADLVAGYGQVIVDECHHLRLIVRETTFPPSTAAADGGIQGLYGTLAQDETRNAMIPARHRAVHRRGIRRSAAGHALPGIAHFLEGDRRPIHRTPASPPPRQVRSPHLRLR